MSVSAASLCGILLLDKPLGLSSNAALQRVRWLLGRPKAGHTGSLDPLATGMLPICIGEATKLAGTLLAGRKGYCFEVRLGSSTDTGDAEGQIVARAAVPELDVPRIESALAALRGAQRQVPPMYSALKRDGQPLYKLARRGQSVERQARDIQIYSLELLGFDGLSVRLRAECSKGTYIRVLGEEVARGLGTVGSLASLRREFVEPFRGEALCTLEQLEADPSHPPLLAADRGVQHLPAVHLDGARSRALAHGQSVGGGEGPAGSVRLYDETGQFMGLGERTGAQTVHARRLFRGALGAVPAPMGARHQPVES